MKESRKTLKDKYKDSPRTMGVFQIRNLVNGKVLVASGLDLPGIINRHRFQLTSGSHQNTGLQSDWNRLGSESFAVEILDQLEPYEGVDHDYREDLLSLESLWLEKLKPFDERGYNERKLGREERLRRIAANTRRASR
jgi:hypothetical protein